MATNLKNSLKPQPDKEDVFDYLSWFYSAADFGPANGDVRLIMERQYQKQTGRLVPDGYRHESEEE
jgi:hypothetical protein